MMRAVARAKARDMRGRGATAGWAAVRYTTPGRHDGACSSTRMRARAQNRPLRAGGSPERHSLLGKWPTDPVWGCGWCAIFRYVGCAFTLTHVDSRLLYCIATG